MSVHVPSVDLGYQPREWQRECHVQMKRFNVLALHRRAGKTVLSLRHTVHHALKNTLPNPMYAYIAPFLKQGKSVAWAMLKQHLRPLIDLGVVETNEGELYAKFKHNNAIIRIFGADNADALRGLYLDGVIMDEVAQMDPTVWHDIVRPMLADRKGRAVFIGTPNGVNLFSELYFNAHKDPANWFSASYTCYDTGALDPDEIADIKASSPPQTFAREMLCDFTAQGDDQLISLADVIAAQKRVLRPEDYNFAPRIIGVDPARFGNDRSVIAKRQGLFVPPPIVLQGIDNVTLAQRVIREAIEWQADAIFCDAGQGAGVIDYLRHLNYDVVEVWFGGKPNLPQYKDKRTEMWCEIADWLPMAQLCGGMSMRQDLAAPTYSFTTAGLKVLESKDDMRKRGLPSPDEGDALATTFAQPVKKKTHREQWFEQHDTRSAPGAELYDPYSNLY